MWILLRRVAASASALALGLGLCAQSDAIAQSKPAAAPSNKAWVKLCETAKIQDQDRRICLTVHERLDGNTGNVIASAAIREVEGQAAKALLLMVPLGMNQRAGLRMTVYTREQWTEITAGRTPDMTKTKPLQVAYTTCQAAGCSGETEATPALIAEMRAGGGMIINALTLQGQWVWLPVVLDGFGEVLDGSPYDNTAYAEARKGLLAEINRRWRAQQGLPPALEEKPFVLGRRVALVIGNSAYSAVSRLTNPAGDARGIAVTLRDLGFADVRERYDLDYAGLTRELKDFGDKARDADWAVIYFAGHGLQINGASYILPVDARLERASHIEDEGVSIERVLSKVQEAKLMRLVILDSCRNNPFLPRLQASGTRSLTRGLSAVEPQGGVMVAYAARDGQTAEDGSGAHSPFAVALMKHLREPGVEISLLFRRVRDSVLKATGGRQEPFTYGSLPGDGYYFSVSARR